MSNCEKCDLFDETTEDCSVLGISCNLCKSCFRAWARRYHKNPKTTRFEVLTARMDLLRASYIGKPLAEFEPYKALDALVEEREACELTLIEDTIDWLEEKV